MNLSLLGNLFSLGPLAPSQTTTSIEPSSPFSAYTAIAAYVPRGHIAAPGPIHTAVLGAALAMARATRTICSAGMPHSLAAKAGVRSFSSRFHHLTTPDVSFSTKASSATVLPATKRFLPSLKSPTNSRFHVPSVRITWAMAPALDKRGSTEITVPRATISWKRWMVFGTWRFEASGSQPQTTRQLVFSRS